jgi:hypothetical protein
MLKISGKYECCCSCESEGLLELSGLVELHAAFELVGRKKGAAGKDWCFRELGSIRESTRFPES